MKDFVIEFGFIGFFYLVMFILVLSIIYFVELLENM